MIENFTVADFAQALPRIGGVEFVSAGVDNGQLVFTCKPGGRFGVLVWSSIDPATGRSGAGAGSDSIRAVCCDFASGKPVPFGGKAARWTDRRPGWQRRLRAVVASLVSQVKALRPCPHCAADLVPLTVKSGANKGRPFVACTSKGCNGRKGDSGFGFFLFTDTAGKASSTPATTSEPTSEAQPTTPPVKSGGEGKKVPCDNCGQSCRVFKAGEHTKNAGRLFISCKGCGRWTTLTEEDVEAAVSGVYGQTPPVNVRTDPRAALETALRALDAGDVAVAFTAAAKALRDLIDGQTGGRRFDWEAEAEALAIEAAQV